MNLRFTLTTFFLFLLSISIAQSNDTAASQKRGRFSVDVMAGVNFMYYKNTAMQGFGSLNRLPDSASLKPNDFNKSVLKRLPLGKIQVNYRFNKYLGLNLGVKYSYYSVTLDYTSTYNDVTRPYQSTGHFNLKVNDLQLCIGPKINVQRFYASASLNLNQLFIRQQVSGNYHSSPAIYNSSSNEISFIKRAYPGAGINIGYEQPIKKNALVVELQCDFITERVSGLYDLYSGIYTFKMVQPAIVIGYKFTTNYSEHQNRDSIKVRQKGRFGFEIMAGLISYNSLNKPFNTTTPIPYGYEYKKLTFKKGKANISPSLKLAFSYKINKYLGIVLGAKYIFIAPIQFDYADYERTSQPFGADNTDYGYMQHFRATATHDLQIFIGPKISVAHFYFMPTFNVNVLHVLDDYVTNVGYSGVGGGTIWYNIEYASDGKWTNESAPGVGANLGYEVPLKKHTVLKIELQCDYLQRNITVGTKKGLNLLGTGIAMGFKF